MKATGIVRRIDDCVIIRQKPINRINTGFFNGFCPKIFEKQYIWNTITDRKRGNLTKKFNIGFLRIGNNLSVFLCKKKESEGKMKNNIEFNFSYGNEAEYIFVVC